MGQVENETINKTTMRIFSKEGSWTSKVNFVDEDNVLLGYDTSQSCCEHAGWFIADEPMEKIVVNSFEPSELPGWKFDKSYFREVSYIEAGSGEYKYNELDDGGMVIFRITNGRDQKFIHLFNCHNGYYSHGFNFNDGESVIQSGSI